MSTSKKVKSAKPKLSKKTRTKPIKKPVKPNRTNPAAKDRYDQCVRSLQKIEALLIPMQNAANYDVEFDVADALLTILELVEQLLLALDELETVI